MEQLRLGLVQMRCEKGKIEDNINSMREYIKACKAEKADIVCFPEMNITGYVNPFKLPEAVMTRESEAIEQVAEMSGIYGIVIIAGFIEKNVHGKPYITQLVAQGGSIAGFYRKRTIKAEEAEWFNPGDAICMFSCSGTRFGITVCADIDDESIFREYARNGTDVVLECAAPGLYGEQETRNWQSGYEWWKGECMSKLGRYAGENGIYIAVSTQAGRTIDEDFPGGGYVFDRKGKCIRETGGWQEGVLYVDLQDR